MKYLVLGATGDLGYAVSRRLVASGHQVIVHGSAPSERLNRLAAELLADFVSFDVRNVERVREVIGAFAEIDGLVYCCAVNPSAFKIAEMPFDSWRQILDVNLDGAFTCLQSAIPALQRSSNPSVVLVSSVFGLQTPGRRSAYGASKHALSGLVQACVKEEGAWLRVNEVCPGPMWSENLRNILQLHADSAGVTLEEYILSRVQDIPMGRFMRLEECASVIAFLLSPAASFINGASIPVTGGAIQ